MDLNHALENNKTSRKKCEDIYLHDLGKDLSSLQKALI